MLISPNSFIKFCHIGYNFQRTWYQQIQEEFFRRFFEAVFTSRDSTWKNDRGTGTTGVLGGDRLESDRLEREIYYF